MAELGDLALSRIKGDLPTFGGATLPEQLLMGRTEAKTILLQYVPELRFDVQKAREVMSQVDAWVERNKAELEQALQSPQQELPRWLQFNMGSTERVQNWIIANYTLAAQGLGPWESGMVARSATEPDSGISDAWARTDAESRLQAFALIVKMERDGDLAYIFRGEGSLAGLGIAPALLLAVVVAVIGLAAVIVSYFFLARRLEVNNAVMRDLCMEAQKRGDKATVEKCIEATRDIQAIDPFTSVSKEVGKAILIVGGGYVLIRYGLPWLLEVLGGGKESRAARSTEMRA